VSSPASLLDDRYGRSRPVRRLALTALVGLVVVVFLAWVAWVAWLHGTPQVQSELVGYTVVDEHTVTAEVDVAIESGADARCLIRAIAEDHTPVGELSFVPTDGLNEVVVRTERAATSAELVGCTTPEQDRPS